MTLNEIIALSTAGFTKQEILSLTKIAPQVPQVQQVPQVPQVQQVQQVPQAQQAQQVPQVQQAPQTFQATPLTGAVIPINPVKAPAHSAADEILGILNSRLQGQARIGDVQPPQQTGEDVLASIIDPPGEREFTDRDIRNFLNN